MKFHRKANSDGEFSCLKPPNQRLLMHPDVQHRDHSFTPVTSWQGEQEKGDVQIGDMHF